MDMTLIFLMDLYQCSKQNQIFIKIHLGIIYVYNFVVIMLFLLQFLLLYLTLLQIYALQTLTLC